MSKIFYDHLIYLEEVEVFVKKTARDLGEREELWGLVDEIIHHKVFDMILGKLPRENHEEFMEMFHKCPYDETYIMTYLKKKADPNIADYIKNGLKDLGKEILDSISE